ncbi:PilZ domain-containing protein [Sphingomonas sp. So64.6b]|uniref:PilZ domain-containing protein n=1 Tax=Sphingomonas sp. So64.6b TaxID=2997354 RepID=UPI0015FF0D09|nr:PilZ domain-containing protein [Sphingomonas sp. So64.6b]QNA83869.1 PilZ domain-containing protein [Sphingomonas sp. So64.6b]
MGLAHLSFNDQRERHRVAVFHRTRGIGPDGHVISLVIVDLSVQGLMARCVADLPIGTRLQVTLPRFGTRHATVRWALGGRIGCELDHALDLADYYELLAMLIRGNAS